MPQKICFGLSSFVVILLSMNASEKFAQICRISTIINDLNMMGITITVGSDFNEYKLIREKQENRSNIYPMFDSTCSFVDHTNGFWIVGSNQQGKVVHTQAIRLLEMSSTSLDEHLMLHRHKYITPGTTPNPDKTFFKVPGSLEHIKGKVCYHGEFWISSEERNQSLTQLLSRVVFDLALSTWNPDFVFGFVPLTLAYKGIPARYGYCHSEHGIWAGPENEVTSEEALVWMSRKDLENTTSNSVVELIPKPKLKPALYAS